MECEPTPEKALRMFVDQKLLPALGECGMLERRMDCQFTAPGSSEISRKRDALRNACQNVLCLLGDGWPRGQAIPEAIADFEQMVSKRLLALPEHGAWQEPPLRNMHRDIQLFPFMCPDIPGPCNRIARFLRESR